MRLTTFLMIVSFLTSACAKTAPIAPDTSPYPIWTKGLNSVWSNQIDTIDLSKTMQASPPPVKVTFQDGSICQTNLAISGQSSVGSMTITASVYIGGGSGDPGCASLIDNYTYQNPTGFALILCSSTSCSTYR